MKEIKCPKCGSVFTVDEADYASIVSQVKNAEFNEEVNRRLQELHERHKTEEQLAIAQVEKDYQEALSNKELEIKEKEANTTNKEELLCKVLLALMRNGV